MWLGFGRVKPHHGIALLAPLADPGQLHWWTVEPRAYQPSDHAACLAIFDSNNPAAGRAEFEQFLDSQPANYTVLEHEGAILGCGGYGTGTDGAATLHHGMIRRDSQRQGLGRFLLLYRLRQISRSNVSFVRLCAPPETAPFYLKQGFKPAGAAGSFVMKLTVCP